MERERCLVTATAGNQDKDGTAGLLPPNDGLGGQSVAELQSREDPAMTEAELQAFLEAHQLVDAAKDANVDGLLAHNAWRLREGLRVNP